MYEPKTDYNKINRRLRRKKLQKHLSFLWTLLIVPLGFVLYYVTIHGKSESSRPHNVAMASPVRVMPVHRVAPVAPPVPRAMPAKAVSGARGPKAKSKAAGRAKTRSVHHAKARRGAVGNASGLVKE